MYIFQVVHNLELIQKILWGPMVKYDFVCGFSLETNNLKVNLKDCG